MITMGSSLRFCRTYAAIVLIVAGLSLRAADAKEWFVAPDGEDRNQGTLTSPWDLVGAVSGKKPVAPGDTIWLRGGVYKNPQSEFVVRLSGQPEHPVIVRNYRNERATIDGAVVLDGSDVWVWGLEVTVSAPRPNVPMPKGSHPPELKRPGGGIHNRTGERCKAINCILHDNNQGFSWWLGAIDAEIYGCIIYRNGWVGVDRTHGHAVYTQNDKGTKRIVDNIMFDPYSYNLHAYGSSRAYVNGFHVEGNIFFGGTVLIGGGKPSERIAFINNTTYRAETRFGYNAPYNVDVVCKGNYFAGGLTVHRYRRAVVMDNEFVANASGNAVLPEGGTFEQFQWDRNRYVIQSAQKLHQWRAKTGFDKNSALQIETGGRPKRNHIFVRPNQYEPGRANVAVYNWEGKPTTAIDLKGALTPGQHFEIRNVQDLYGEPVARGVYDGMPITVPLLRGARKVELRLSGDPTNRVWDVFGDYPDFDAFVVLPIAP